MKTAAVAFLLATLCAAVLTPLLRLLAERRGFLDHGLSQRKVHGRPIPRLGGVAIVLAFYAPLVALLFTKASGVGLYFYQDRVRASALFVGGLLVAALGVWDDLRGANAWQKFTVQFLVAGLMYGMGFRILEVASPFGDPVALGPLGLPFTLLWIVGVVNAMNLIDGLDGLAGGVALFAVATTFLIAVGNAQPLMMLITASLGGAVLGFLFFNFNPASIFMGDTGSMFLGFVLATSAIRTNQKSSTTVAILIPIVALGLPILDTLLAMTRRALRGRPLFQADREHIHHRLLALGLTHRQAVLALYAICLVFALVALVLTFSSRRESAALLVALGIMAFLLLRRLGYLQFGGSFRFSEARRRNRELRSAVRAAGMRLRDAGRMDEVWDVVASTASAFGAVHCSVAVILGPVGGGGPAPLYRRDSGDAPEGLRRIRLPLAGDAGERGALELAFPAGAREPDRDAAIALELLGEHVAWAVERLHPSGPPEVGRPAKVLKMRR